MANKNTTLDSPDNITEKQLQWSYWFVRNKSLLKKIGLGLFATVGGALLLYGIYGFADYLLITGPREAREIASLGEDTTNYRSLNSQLGARPLDVKSTVLLRGKTTYDAFSFISNRNERWLATFKYQFSIDGDITEKKEGFLLPEESKFIADLGISLAKTARQASILISDLKWRRISTREIEDYKDWSESRLNFKVVNSQFSPVVGLDQGSASRASFSVKNLSAFNYWQVGFRVVLYRGATIVGMNYITIPRFRSGEEREAEVTWFDPIGQVSKIEIEPEVDIFDDNVYMW